MRSAPAWRASSPATSATSLAAGLAKTAYELGASLLVGCVGGFGLKAILAKLQDDDAELTFAVGAVLLAIGLSIALELDVILASMALGLTLVNIAPHRGPRTFEIVKRFAPPIYVLFFVLVGARLKIESLSLLVVLLVIAYVVGRSVGKIGGAYLGGKWSGASRCVRNYLGICLFAQGGVAIGLSILASHRFTPEISSTVILVVASTTFIVQLVGPLFVRLGVKKAGEIGLNVREEDLVRTLCVADVADAKVPIIPVGAPLKEVIRTVSGTEAFYYPVVDRENRLVGAITLHGIRNTFATQELDDWLVALDIMEPVVATVLPQTPLAEAFIQARRYNIDHLPVVDLNRQNALVGVLDCPAVRRSLSAEVLSRRQKADNSHDGVDV